MEIRVLDEFKNLIPPLSKSEYRQLEMSILSEGCREPICVWNGVIVDGHNRFEICTKLGVPYTIRNIPFNSADEARHWIVTNQLGRRNISVFDRCLLALEMEGFFRAKAKLNQATSTGGKNPQLLQERAKGEPVNTRKEVARLAGVSSETLRKVKKIKESGTKRQIELIRTNQQTVNYSYYKIIGKERDRIERQELAVVTPTDNPNIQLYIGDFFEVAESITTESVDCIITDPLWSKSHVEACGQLAKVAARILKPGGSMLVLLGNTALPDYLSIMKEHLDYCWTLCYFCTKPSRPFIWEHQIVSQWKPLVWFSKGKPSKPWSSDIVSYAPADNRNHKSLYRYQQSEEGFLEIVKAFTTQGDLVLDPFMGSGTTGVACVKTARRFVGVEIKKRIFKIAQGRIYSDSSSLSTTASNPTLPDSTAYFVSNDKD